MKKLLHKTAETIDSETASLVQQLLKYTLKALILDITSEITPHLAQELEYYDLNAHIDEISTYNLRAILLILKESAVGAAAQEKITFYLNLANKTQAKWLLDTLFINSRKHRLLKANSYKLRHLASQGYDMEIIAVGRLLADILYDLQLEGVLKQRAESTSARLYFFLLYQLQILSEIKKDHIEQKFGVKIPDEIGVYLSNFTENPFDQYIFTGAASAPNINIVKQVAARLEETGEFQDTEHNRIDPSILMLYLMHPHFQIALNLCNDREVTHGIVEASNISQKTILELNVLKRELWESSLDSRRESFDDTRAYEAMTRWSVYASSEDDTIKKDLEKLKLLSFSLPSRDNTITSFDDVFKRPTFDACSGQLGLAIKQWVAAFLAEVEQSRESDLNNEEESKTTFYAELLTRANQLPLHFICNPSVTQFNDKFVYGLSQLFNQNQQLKLLTNMTSSESLLSLDYLTQCNSKALQQLHINVKHLPEAIINKIASLIVVQSTRGSKNTGLHLFSFYTPKILPQLLGLIEKTANIANVADKLADTLQKKNTNGWTGLEMVARHAPETLPHVLTIISKSTNRTNVGDHLADALQKQAPDDWNGLKTVAHFAPKSLPQLLGIIEKSKNITKVADQLTGALQKRDARGWNGLQRVVCDAPEAFPLLLKMIEKSHNIAHTVDQLVDALQNITNTGWSSLQAVANYAPPGAFLQLLRIIENSDNIGHISDQLISILQYTTRDGSTGLQIISHYAADALLPLLTIVEKSENIVNVADQFADKLQKQNSFGWSGLQTLARYTPDSLLKLLTIVKKTKNIAKVADQLTNGLHAHNIYEYTGLHTVACYAPKALLLLLAIIKQSTNITNVANQLACALRKQSSNGKTGLQIIIKHSPEALPNLLYIAIKSDSNNLYEHLLSRFTFANSFFRNHELTPKDILSLLKLIMQSKAQHDITTLLEMIAPYIQSWAEIYADRMVSEVDNIQNELRIRINELQSMIAASTTSSFTQSLSNFFKKPQPSKGYLCHQLLNQLQQQFPVLSIGNQAALRT